MSWSELARLVKDAASDARLLQKLQDCATPQDLVLAARRRGYRITRIDVERALLKEKSPEARSRESLH